MKQSKFKSWKHTAQVVQKHIADSKDAIVWWKNNYQKVNSKEGEYPVMENLPLLEEYEPINIIQPKKCDPTTSTLIEAIIDIYWWNTDPFHFSKVRIKLPKSLLEIIRWRFIEGLSNKQIREKYNITKNNINKRIRRLSKKLDVKINKKGVYLW